MNSKLRKPSIFKFLLFISRTNFPRCWEATLSVYSFVTLIEIFEKIIDIKSSYVSVLFLYIAKHLKQILFLYKYYSTLISVIYFEKHITKTLGTTSVFVMCISKSHQCFCNVFSKNFFVMCISKVIAYTSIKYYIDEKKVCFSLRSKT